MTNLWKETIGILEEHGLSFDDVLYIQGNDFQITKGNFVSVATYTDYSSGYGAQRVPKDLVLVGEDWWIERYEYDGAEWWDFKSIPARKQYMKNITNLHKGMWDTLKEMNEE